MELDRRLRFEATRGLRQTNNVRDALQWISRNPEGFATRVSEFEDTIGAMNDLMLGDAIDARRYGSVAALRGFFVEGEPISTPSDLVTLYDDWREYGEYEETGRVMQSFFPKIHNIIATHQWEFPTQITDNPNKLASGLLIEGYGQLMEDLYEKPGLARKFVLGFEEVLISQRPDAAILSDVIDWMAEEKDDFSPAVKADIEEALTEPKTELEQAVRHINRTFKRGGEAHEVIEDIRKLPRPIAVDFNNVIANNNSPLALNPDASAFLQGLRQIGNVVIVTSASGWEAVQGFLQEHGLWSKDMVLMTAPTYEFISQWQEENPKAKELRKEFLVMAQQLGWQYEEDDLVQAPAGKAVAPIFGKPFEVPIIDDSSFATRHNPGMLGINVQAWETNEEMQRMYERSNQGKPTLAEAVELVRNHYSGITTS